MKKLDLKKIYNSDYFWIVLSVIASFMLWMYITSVEETIQQNTYSGIPVVFTGEEAIRDSRGLIISDVDTTSVRVKISGNRRALSKFNASDLQATIDVSRVTQANENSWAYELTFPSGVDTSGFTYEYYPDVINFTVEKEDKYFLLRGGGHGHGTGMSQYGAKYLAKKGRGYEEILKHYYREVDITYLYQ